MRRSQIVSLLLAILIGFGSLAGVLAAGWAPVLGVQLQGGVEVLLRPTAPADDEQLDRAIEIIRSRVDALGVAEPDITRQGEQVVVQLPGVKDKQRAVDLVGQTAELRFRPVLLTFNPFDEAEFGSALDLADAYNGAIGTFNNEWVVNVDLTDEGAVGFDEIAARYFGQQVAIVLDGVVESAPVIRATEFGGTAVISGTFDEDGARDLAVALRFGALPVEFEQDDVRTVSATLGEGTLRAGVIAGIVGLILVGLYMLAYYRLLGIVAVASLAISGSVLWSLISWLGESRGLALTLAGTTGIIVSIGVQVDSNIVYYERIKEEVRRGRAVRSAADASFKGAFMTIVWADLASLIGAGVLYQLTSGTVRGFALYLGLATLIDLAVSYFFMRPLVVFIARRLVNEEPRRLGVLRTADGDVAPATDPTGGTS
ncbi:preprotein translocase subunit SecD [Candidatus Poriferisodalis multihospitum]|uniref:preprotein translocase subunit SecD n=1 Tax=Candidatus Poriferisodalis multihospitum TaxID=2983191 RepID=UPI002B261224|nr:preprotein translocase subunit SecD [Candidatus Poriferisodalis multihospitum]